MLGACDRAQPREHHIPGVPLDQRGDRRAAIGPHRTGLPPSARAPRGPRPPAGRSEIETMSSDPPAPLRGAPRWRRLVRPVRRCAVELAAQLPAGLHEQRLIDRLVTDPHLQIIGMIGLQSAPRSAEATSPPTAPASTAASNRGDLASLPGLGRRAARSARSARPPTGDTRHRPPDRLISRPIVERCPTQRPGDLRITLAAPRPPPESARAPQTTTATANAPPAAAQPSHAPESAQPSATTPPPHQPPPQAAHPPTTAPPPDDAQPDLTDNHHPPTRAPHPPINAKHDPVASTG